MGLARLLHRGVAGGRSRFEAARGLSEHLSYEVVGDERGPALLLLHGFLSSNLQWEPNRERLGSRLRLVLVELWGHGRSPAPREAARYRVASYLAELERVRAALGIGRWLVCGQSFGGGIAMRYAATRPDVVSGFVFTNSRSALNDLAGEATAPAGGRSWESVDLRSLPYHPAHAKRFPPDLKARMERAADAIPLHAVREASVTTARELSCRHLIPQLRVPTLLVNGRFEKAFQPDRDFAARSIAGIEIVDLDGGHSVNVEAAEGFDRAVLGFAQRLGEGGSEEAASWPGRPSTRAGRAPGSD